MTINFQGKETTTLTLTNSELFSLILSLKNHRLEIKSMIENPCVYDSAGDEIGVDEKYLTDLKNLLDEKAKLGKKLVAQFNQTMGEENALPMGFFN